MGFPILRGQLALLIARKGVPGSTQGKAKLQTEGDRFWISSEYLGPGEPEATLVLEFSLI